MEKNHAENNMLADVQGVIFDYGGTIDTDGQHWGKKIWHAYERLAIPITEAQFRDAYVAAERTLGRSPLIRPDHNFLDTLQMKNRIQLEHLCMNGHWEADEEMFRQMHTALVAHLYEDTAKTVARNKGILSLMAERFPMVLVSNFYGNLCTVLREFALDGLFRHVVESATVGIRKPESRIFQIGADALGLSPAHVVSIGDSFYKDVEPAKKIGCHTIWLKGEGWTSATYDESVPDAIIHSLSELCGIFQLS